MINLDTPQPGPQAMIAKGCKLRNICLTTSSAVHLLIRYKLTNRCGFHATTTEKTGLVEAASMNEQVWTEASDVLHDRLSEKSLTVIPNI